MGCIHHATFRLFVRLCRFVFISLVRQWPTLKKSSLPVWVLKLFYTAVVFDCKKEMNYGNGQRKPRCEPDGKNDDCVSERGTFFVRHTFALQRAVRT